MTGCFRIFRQVTFPPKADPSQADFQNITKGEFVMNFVKDTIVMFGEMLGDWPVGTILGTIIIAVFLLIILLTSLLVMRSIFIAIDSWFLPRNQGRGRVMGKKIIPAHTEMCIGGGPPTAFTFYPVSYPAVWSVCVEVSGKQAYISVKQEFFDSISEGDSVFVEYVHGRLSGSLYLKNLSRA
jgi:hypothetical protein